VNLVEVHGILGKTCVKKWLIKFLKHYWQELKFAEKFTEGMKDALLVAESISLTYLMVNLLLKS
jgi:hypothetical protein